MATASAGPCTGTPKASLSGPPYIPANYGYTQLASTQSINPGCSSTTYKVTTTAAGPYTLYGFCPAGACSGSLFYQVALPPGTVYG